MGDVMKVVIIDDDINFANKLKNYLIKMIIKNTRQINARCLLKANANKVGIEITVRKYHSEK